MLLLLLITFQKLLLVLSKKVDFLKKLQWKCLCFLSQIEKYCLDKKLFWALELFFQTYIIQVAGPALGARLGVRKIIEIIEIILKKYIKDSYNSTKIGVTNIFWGNYLDSKLKLSRYSNISDMGNSFRSNFCHQEGSGIIFKYSVILG